jgi:sirohydrochlorin ferrochelatase
MVHGSPKPEANDEMFQVVEMVREREHYPIVEVGFMECNEPSISEAIEACVVKGADRIDAVPYFLHMGTHVADDLPALLEAEAAKWTSVHFRLGEYIGRSKILTNLLAIRANEALEQIKEAQHAR